MPDITYKYSRRRRSIGLTVTVEGEVVVAAPVGTPDSRIKEALTRHRDWLARTVAARKEAWAQVWPGAAYYLGEPLRLVSAPAAAAAVELGPQELRVAAASHNAGLWDRLQAWYRGEAERVIGERVSHFAALMGLEPGPVQLRDWRRRWGECHPDGRLRFNWRLILLPPEMLDYVVVHELAHLKVPGHPPKFWRQVAKVMPDWAPRRRRLNREGAPFLGWQVGNEE